MNTIKERRQDQRFEALDNILAINIQNFGQVINISMGGLRIKYLVRPNEPFEHSFKISLLNGAGDQCIKSLACKTISFNDFGPIAPSINLFTREARVMFTDLTTSQKNQLADFVLHNTLIMAHA